MWITVRRTARVQEGDEAPPRAWGDHGFDDGERARWHAAGWRDPALAERWRRARPDRDPTELHELSQGRYRPDQVAAVERFVTTHVAAWAGVFLADRAGDVTIDLEGGATS